MESQAISRIKFGSYCPLIIDCGGNTEVLEVTAPDIKAPMSARISLTANLLAPTRHYPSIEVYINQERRKGWQIWMINPSDLSARFAVNAGDEITLQVEGVTYVGVNISDVCVEFGWRSK